MSQVARFVRVMASASIILHQLVSRINHFRFHKPNAQSSTARVASTGILRLKAVKLATPRV